MLTKIIYKNFRSNLKNYILFFLSNIVAIMELFVFRGLKEIVLQIVKDTETAFLFRIDFTIALGMISVITIMLMAYAMIYYLKSRIRDYGLFIMMGMHKRMVFSLMLIEYVLGWVFSSILWKCSYVGHYENFNIWTDVKDVFISDDQYENEN